MRARPDAYPYVPPTLVGLGDSITKGDSTPTYFAWLYQMYPGVAYVNAGHSGYASGDLVPVARQLAVPEGSVVVLECGTGDTSQGVPIATTLANVDAMVGSQPNCYWLLMSVLPRAFLPGQQGDHAAVSALRAALGGYAFAHGIPFVDPFRTFEDQANPGAMLPTLTLDGIHPNACGQSILARAIAAQLGWNDGQLTSTGCT